MWRPNPATVALGVIGVVIAALGLWTGRADVLAFGVAPIVAAFTLTGHRPEFATGQRFVEAPSEAGVFAADLTLEPADEAALLLVRAFAPGHRPRTVAVAARPARHLSLQARSARTGPSRTFDVQARAISQGAAYVEDPRAGSAAPRLVLPLARRLAAVPLPTRLRGLTGPRRSHRFGDGTELRDVHPMAPGDQARRVDWRATARRSPELSELYIRRTFATAEAQGMLVLDSRDEVGSDLSQWFGSEALRVDEATSLDLARTAAISIATAFTDAGDRIGLVDLARPRRPLAPAMGRRHLRRIQYALAVAAPFGEPTPHLRPPQLPSDAIVYLLTTLLDDAPLDLVRGWQSQGLPVVVIDTLPAIRPVTHTHLLLAWRITTMERADRLRALQAQHIPVVRWADRAAAPEQLAASARERGRR